MIWLDALADATTNLLQCFGLVKSIYLANRTPIAPGNAAVVTHPCEDIIRWSVGSWYYLYRICWYYWLHSVNHCNLTYLAYLTCWTSISASRAAPVVLIRLDLIRFHLLRMLHRTGFADEYNLIPLNNLANQTINCLKWRCKLSSSIVRDHMFCSFFYYYAYLLLLGFIQSLQ